MKKVTDFKPRKQQLKFTSSNKYTPIFGKVWLPEDDKNPKGILQIAHGMAEYIDRYDDFASYLAKNGWVVVGNDMMGHGKSVYSEDDYGYFSIPIKGLSKEKDNVNNSSAYVVKDLHHITMAMKKRYPDKPYILLGHSMGSFMVRRYLMEYGGDLEGIIIMGTGDIENTAVKAAKIVVETMKLTYGERHRSNLIYKLLYDKKFNERIENPISGNAWISTDDEVVKAYDEDKLCGFKFTLNGFEAILRTLEFINNQDNKNRIPKDSNILFVSGGEDPLGDYGNGVNKISAEYKDMGIEDIKTVIYEGMRHEILNEIGKEKVYEDILNWLNKRADN